ncbi:7TM GPCR, serpentine receptor class g (Srg) family-containing protein [Strongyloides ratti]|uniref:Serpentine receptor class gamma n=1 Tax=Strongyloides ratti TaxID=34506 RepID=A0A090LIB7_STRRB|nr:7TM GPCR, serpentine receptor class g (Srg) family-containing protein [Strongyloides ratti]CEF67210.1 7TM GPCR, serpentine receptor class g (Srg) family-containing protein [Strongyloides ratti]
MKTFHKWKVSSIVCLLLLFQFSNASNYPSSIKLLTEGIEGIQEVVDNNKPSLNVVYPKDKPCNSRFILYKIKPTDSLNISTYYEFDLIRKNTDDIILMYKYVPESVSDSYSLEFIVYFPVTMMSTMRTYLPQLTYKTTPKEHRLVSKFKMTFLTNPGNLDMKHFFRQETVTEEKYVDNWDISKQINPTTMGYELKIVLIGIGEKPSVSGINNQITLFREASHGERVSILVKPLGPNERGECKDVSDHEIIYYTMLNEFNKYKFFVNYCAPWKKIMDKEYVLRKSYFFTNPSNNLLYRTLSVYVIGAPKNFDINLFPKITSYISSIWEFVGVQIKTVYTSIYDDITVVAKDNMPTLYFRCKNKNTFCVSVVYVDESGKMDISEYIDKEVIFVQLTKSTSGKYKIILHYYGPYNLIASEDIKATNAYIIIPATNSLLESHVEMRYISEPSTLRDSLKPQIYIVSPGSKLPELTTFNNKDIEINTLPAINPTICIFKPKSIEERGLYSVIYEQGSVPPTKIIENSITVYITKSNSQKVINHKFIYLNIGEKPQIPTDSKEIVIFIQFVKIFETENKYNIMFYVFVPWNHIIQNNLELPELRIISPDYNKYIISPANIIYLIKPPVEYKQPIFILPYNPDSNIYIKEYFIQISVMLQYFPKNSKPPVKSIDNSITIYKEFNDNTCSIVYLFDNQKANYEFYTGKEVIFYRIIQVNKNVFKLSFEIYAPWSKIVTKEYKLTRLFVVFPKIEGIKFEENIDYTFINHPVTFNPPNRYVIILLSSGQWPILTTTTTTTTTPKPEFKVNYIYKASKLIPGIIVAPIIENIIPKTTYYKDHITIYVKSKSQNINFEVIKNNKDVVPIVSSNSDNVTIYIKMIKMKGSKDKYFFRFFVSLYEKCKDNNCMLPKIYIIPDNYKKQIITTESIIYLQQYNTKFIYVYNPYTISYVNNYDYETSFDIVYHDHEESLPLVKTFYNKPTIYVLYNPNQSPITFVQIHNVNETNTKPYIGETVYFYTVTKTSDEKILYTFYLYAPWSDIINNKLTLKNLYIVLPNENFDQNIYVEYIECPESVPAYKKPVVLVAPFGVKEWPQVPLYPGKPSQAIIAVPPKPGVINYPLYSGNSVPTKSHTKNDITFFVRKNSLMVCEYEIEEFRGTGSPSIDGLHRKIYIFVKFVKLPTTNEEYEVKLYVFIPWQHITKMGLEFPLVNVIGPDHKKIFIRSDNVFYLNPLQNVAFQRNFISMYNPELGIYTKDYNVDTNIYLQFINMLPRAIPIDWRPTIWKPIPQQGPSKFQIIYLQNGESPNPKANSNNEVVYYSTTTTVDGRFQYTLYYQVPFLLVDKKEYQCTNVYFVVPRTGKFARKIEINYLNRPKNIPQDKCIIVSCPSNKIEWVYPTTTVKPTTTTTTTTTIPPPVQVIPTSYPGNGIKIITYDTNIGRPNPSTEDTIIYVPHSGTPTIDYIFEVYNGTNIPSINGLDKKIKIFVKYLTIPEAPHIFKMIFFTYVPWDMLSKENKKLPQFYVSASKDKIIFGPDSIFYLNSPNPYPPVFIIPYDWNILQYIENYSPEVNIMIKYISSDEIPPASPIYGRVGIYKRGKPIIFFYRSDRNAPIDVNNFSNKEVIYYSYEIMANGKYNLILDVYVPWHSLLRNDTKPETTFVYTPHHHKYFNPICQVNWIKRPIGFPDHLNPIIITNGKMDRYPVYTHPQPNEPMDLIVFEESLPNIGKPTYPVLYVPNPQIYSGRKIDVELIHINEPSDIKINNSKNVLIFYRYVKRNHNNIKYAIELNVYCPWNLFIEGKIELSVIFIKIPSSQYIDSVVIKKFIKIPENIPEEKKPIIVIIRPDENNPNFDKIASIIRLNVSPLAKGQKPSEGVKSFHPSIFIQQSDDKVLPTTVIKLESNNEKKLVTDENKIILYYRVEKNDKKEYIFKIYYSAPWKQITKRQSFIPPMYIYIPRNHLFLQPQISIEYIGDKNEIDKTFGGIDNISKTKLIPGYSYTYNKYDKFIYPGLSLNVEYIDSDLPIPNIEINNQPTIYRKKFGNGTKPILHLIKLKKGENPDITKYKNKEVIFYMYKKPSAYEEKYKLYLYIYANWELIISSSSNDLEYYFQTLFVFIDKNNYLVTKPANIEFINIPSDIIPYTGNMCIENNPSFPLNIDCKFCEKIKNVEFVYLQPDDIVPSEAKKNHPTVYIKKRGYYDKKINTKELKNEEELSSDLGDTPTIMYNFNKKSNGKLQLIIYYYAPWNKIVNREIIVPDIYAYIPKPSKYYEDPAIIKYIGDFSLLPEEKAPKGVISTYHHPSKAYTPIIYPGLKLMLKYVKANADVPLETYKKYPTLYKKMDENGNKPKITLIPFTGEIKMNKERKNDETIIYYTYVKFPMNNRKYSLQLFVDGPWKLYQNKELENHNIFLFIDIQDQLVKKPAIVTYLNQDENTHDALKHSVIEDYSNENYPDGIVIDALLKSGIEKVTHTVPTEGYRGLPSIYERVRGDGFKFVELKKNEEPKSTSEPTVFIKFEKTSGKEKKYDFIIFVSAPWDKVIKREILLSDLYVIVPRDHTFVNKKPIINYLGSFETLPNGKSPEGFVSVYNHDSYNFSEILYPGLKVEMDHIKANQSPPTEYLTKYPTIYKKSFPNGSKSMATLIEFNNDKKINSMSNQDDKTILYKYIREKPTSMKYNLEITFFEDFHDVLSFKKFLQTTFIYVKTDDPLINKPAKLSFFGILGPKKKLIEQAFYENNNNTNYPDVNNPYEDKGYKLETKTLNPKDTIPRSSKNNEPTIYIRSRTSNDVIPQIKLWNNKDEPNGLGDGDQPIIYYQFMEIKKNSENDPKYKLKIYYYAPWYKVERRQIILPQVYVYIPKNHPYVDSKPSIKNIGDFSELDSKTSPEPCISYYDHSKDKYSSFSYPGLLLDLSYLNKLNTLPPINNKFIPTMYKKSYLDGTYPDISIMKLKINQEPKEESNDKQNNKENVYYKYVNLNDTDPKFTLMLYIQAPYDKLIDGSAYFQTAYIMVNPTDPIISNDVKSKFMKCPFDDKIISPAIVSSDSNGMITNQPLNYFDDSLHHVDTFTLPTSEDIPKKSRNNNLFVTIYERPRSSINLKYNYKSHPINATTSPSFTELGNQPHMWYQIKRVMNINKKYDDIKNVFTHQITFYIYNNWVAVEKRDIFIPDIYIYIPNTIGNFEIIKKYLGIQEGGKHLEIPKQLISNYNHDKNQYPAIEYPGLTISLDYLEKNEKIPTVYINNRPTIYKTKYNNGMKPKVEMVKLNNNETPNTKKFTDNEVIFYSHKKTPKTTEVKYILYLYIYAPFEAILKGNKFYQTSYLYIDKNDDLIEKNAKVEYLGVPEGMNKLDCLLQQHKENGYPDDCTNPFAEPEYTIETEKLKPTDDIPTVGKNNNPTIYVRPRDDKDISIDVLPMANKTTPPTKPTIYYGFVTRKLHQATIPVFTLYYHVDWEMVKNFKFTLPEVYAINGDSKYPLPPEGIFPGAEKYNDKDITGLISCFKDGKYPQITYPFIRTRSETLENTIKSIPTKEINSRPTIYLKKTQDNIEHKYDLVYLSYNMKPNTAGYRDKRVIFYRYIKKDKPTSLKYQLEIFMLAQWNDIHERNMLYEVPYIYISKNNRFFLPEAKVKMLELPTAVYEQDVAPLQFNHKTNKYPQHLCYYCIQPYVLKLETLKLKQESPNRINDRIPRAFMEKNSNAVISFDIAPLPKNIDFDNHYTYGPQLYYKYIGEKNDRKRTLHIYTFTDWLPIRKGSIVLPTIRIFLPKDSSPIEKSDYYSIRSSEEVSKLPIFSFYGYVHPESRFYNEKIILHHYEIKRGGSISEPVTTKRPVVHNKPVKKTEKTRKVTKATTKKVTKVTKKKVTKVTTKKVTKRIKKQITKSSKKPHKKGVCNIKTKHVCRKCGTRPKTANKSKLKEHKRCRQRFQSSFTLHHRFPNYGIFLNIYYNLYINKTDVRILEFLRTYSNVCQLVGTFFLSFNRFTSLAYPIKHKFLWEKLLPFSLITIFLLPLILTWPILCDKMCYVLQNSSNIKIGFRAKWITNYAAWYNSFLIMSILTFIFIFASLLINMSTLLILVKISKGSNKINGNGNVKTKFNFIRERNFFLTAFISFIGQLILGIDNYVSGYFSKNAQYDNFYIMVMIFPIVNDLSIFPGTWILLYVSTPIRKFIFKKIRKKERLPDTTYPVNCTVVRRSLVI